ncbi:hypothetical protein [Deinococcus sp.]|uniref:hypothetical protein n=1 Tax=Deinococcus sp. TaxID=47478 RepID=UPI0028699CFC|nr:hypothetical protein [Deinococcus sp.]
MTQTTPPVTPVRPIFTLIRRHQNLAALALMVLVASALALDYFHGDLLGPHLIGLRLIYAGITLLTIGYVWIVSGQDAPKTR